LGRSTATCMTWPRWWWYKQIARTRRRGGRRRRGQAGWGSAIRGLSVVCPWLPA